MQQRQSIDGAPNSPCVRHRKQAPSQNGAPASESICASLHELLHIDHIPACLARLPSHPPSMLTAISVQVSSMAPALGGGWGVSCRQEREAGPIGSSPGTARSFPAGWRGEGGFAPPTGPDCGRSECVRPGCLGPLWENSQGKDER